LNVAKVLLRDWRPGLQKIPLTRLMQREAGLTLAPAHANTNRLLERQPVIVTLPTDEAAKRFVREASALGAVAEIVPDQVPTS
jgi:hypothetical protein